MLELPLGITDAWLYSNGKYYLFEKYIDGRIVAKGKWDKREDFERTMGRELTSEQIDQLEQGQTFNIKQRDNSCHFFKWVNL